MQSSEVHGLVVHHNEVWVVWTSVCTKVVVALLLDVGGDSSPDWSVAFHATVAIEVGSTSGSSAVCEIKSHDSECEAGS